MKSILSIFLFIFRLGIGAAAFAIASLISWLVINTSFSIAILSGIVAFFVTFFGLKWMVSSRQLKNSGLSRREYKYIQEHLREGKVKITRLQRVMFSVGSVMTIKQNYDVIKVAKKLHSIVENDPKRFYEAEQFYYSHLDSMVELTEKYAFLTKQPVKTTEIQNSLRDTRITISSMAETINEDLSNLLASDVDTLRLEIDVAKQAIEKNKDPNVKS
ncbi:5-bromo-4-chloroindolyl phosphate hydrolysis family protein [Bacillus massiliigorillae]|uniref:5-bromo-4-chloroindolyl phosphate hydrolysis family protein n=1 Tax=Bacillus massiliigorillae TaxID=1243664 RepID=UPI0003A7158C|nr:5-bromo-4-chloroindolyl phosphate hydrolysis family protein [Bacillus massiliigorillae]